MTKLCSVILAGGEGKRMKSDSPKVLSQVLFKPMIKWVIDSVQECGIEDICVVTGFKHEVLESYLFDENLKCETVVQKERKGTAHAVTMAEDFLKKHSGGHVLILGGDSPFIDAKSINNSYELHISTKSSATVISAKLDNPFGYGRIVRNKSTNQVKAIVEQKDATDKIKKIIEINSGAYWFNVDDLLSVIHNIANNNAQGEYYLPDAIKLLIKKGKSIHAFVAASSEIVLGANDCEQLNMLNNIARKNILAKIMSDGIIIPCTEGVIVSPDVKIGKNVSVLPGTIITGKTTIGNDCILGPNTQIKNSIVGNSCHLNSVCCSNSKIESHQNLGPFVSISNNCDHKVCADL